MISAQVHREASSEPQTSCIKKQSNPKATNSKPSLERAADRTGNVRRAFERSNCSPGRQ